MEEEVVVEGEEGRGGRKVNIRRKKRSTWGRGERKRSGISRAWSRKQR